MSELVGSDILPESAVFSGYYEKILSISYNSFEVQQNQSFGHPVLINCAVGLHIQNSQDSFDAKELDTIKIVIGYILATFKFYNATEHITDNKRPNFRYYSNNGVSYLSLKVSTSLGVTDLTYSFEEGSFDYGYQSNDNVDFAYLYTILESTSGGLACKKVVVARGY